MLFDTSSSAFLVLPGLTLALQAVWSPFKGLEGETLCVLSSSEWRWVPTSTFVEWKWTISLWVTKFCPTLRWIEEGPGRVETDKRWVRNLVALQPRPSWGLSWVFIEGSIIWFAGLWINQTRAKSIHIVRSKTNPDLREKRVLDYIWSYKLSVLQFLSSGVELVKGPVFLGTAG